MKRYILLGSAIALLVLAGCTKTSDNAIDTAVDSNTGAVQTDVLSGTNSTMSSKEAIAAYLAAADFKGEGDKTVEKGNTITVQYVGRLNDSDVFDTSVESIAKAAGKYSSARNYNEGLSFTVGGGQMIAGFDKGVVGMKIGQTKTITIPAKEAYGEWNSGYLVDVPRAQLPEGEYTKGVKLMAANGQTFTVYEVKKDSVVLDGNHELAGKDLIFDITVTEIK